MYGYIYITTNKINNKKYIGQHKSKEHDVNYLGSGKNIRRAIQKYGKENFENHIIEWCETKEELCEREKHWIKYYNAQQNPDFYNISSGGEFGDITAGMTKEEYENWKVKLRNSNNCYWKNKSLPLEMKLKISNTLKNRKLDNNHPFVKGVWKNRKHSEESKRKMSEAKKGKTFSEEHRNNLSKAKKGSSLSEEHKRKIKESCKGKQAGGKHSQAKTVYIFDTNKNLVKICETQLEALDFMKNKYGKCGPVQLNKAIKNNQQYKDFIFSHYLQSVSTKE